MLKLPHTMFLKFIYMSYSFLKMIHLGKMLQTRSVEVHTEQWTGYSLSTS